MSDNSAGSAVDVLKRSESGMNVFKGDMTRGYSVLEWAGVRIIRTQTVPVQRLLTKPNAFTGEDEKLEFTGQELAIYLRVPPPPGATRSA